MTGKTCNVVSQVLGKETLAKACVKCSPETERINYISPWFGNLALSIPATIGAGAGTGLATGGAWTLSGLATTGSITAAGLASSALGAASVGSAGAGVVGGFFGYIAMMEAVPASLWVAGAVSSEVAMILLAPALVPIALGVLGAVYLAKAAKAVGGVGGEWIKETWERTSGWAKGVGERTSEFTKNIADTWNKFFTMNYQLPECISKFNNLKKINADWVGLGSLDSLEGMEKLEKISAVQKTRDRCDGSRGKTGESTEKIVRA